MWLLENVNWVILFFFSHLQTHQNKMKIQENQKNSFPFASNNIGAAMVGWIVPVSNNMNHKLSLLGFWLILMHLMLLSGPHWRSWGGGQCPQSKVNPSSQYKFSNDNVTREGKRLNFISFTPLPPFEFAFRKNFALATALGTM